MNILHTESSNNWGGQEMRILKEAEGMRARGHAVYFAIEKGGRLAEKAREKDFVVYELPFAKRSAIKTIAALNQIIKNHGIDVVNTHSSLDAWLAGAAGRIAKVKIIRTRHLSTPSKPGVNSKLLYRALADFVVTTSSETAVAICSQAGITSDRCRCIPTGVDPFSVDSVQIEEFRRSLGLKPGQILVGTACIVRSWKGIKDLMKAADLLRGDQRIKWAVVGGGYIDQYIDHIDLKGVLTFTGHLDPPHTAIAAMDVFALLSTAHEGISQASLQAAWLERPLVTTPVGGLKEVCLDGATGIQVPPFSPEKVAEAVLKLADDPSLRVRLGKQAKAMVEEKYRFAQTLDAMEEVYRHLKI